MTHAAATGEPRTLAPPERRVAAVGRVERLGAYSLITALDGSGPVDPRPGQFYMLATDERWGGGEDERPYLPRAFSYARARRTREGLELDFLLEAVGPGTERLAALEPGEGLALVGPLGVGFRAPAPGTRPILVGGGIGVAPLVCLQDELLRAAYAASDGAPQGASAAASPGAAAGPSPAGSPTAPPPARPAVLLGFRTAGHARAAALFAGAPELATDDGSAGRRAVVTRLLEERLAAEPQVAVFACGPPAMLEAVRALCAERGVPAQLALESGMACGFGACMGCVVPTRGGYLRLCVDGPVVPADLLDATWSRGAAH